MIFLGIESSHDDTSIGIVENGIILLNYKISQIDVHKQYGGTVPEIASREHVNNFAILLEKLKKDFELNRVDYIAYTEKPGLLGSLQMGYLFAHALSISLNKELIPVDHLEGHIYSVLLRQKNEKEKKILYPSLSLVVSGGHTSLFFHKNEFEFECIGKTLDDSLGEVFDKVARSLGFGFPGGQIIDDIFNQNENKDIIPLTTPKTKNKFDFSFSGLKTQVINIIHNSFQKQELLDKNKVAYSFQKQSIDYLISVTKEAIKEYKPKTLILSGGVSANSYLRSEYIKLHKNTLIPIEGYSTDNGAMIAVAAEILCKQ
ncbi:MAG: tRNA (adenosine(37)-N6)-threonylcarbamoyltransferase complex transferase subunit TsaD [Metamycoplasmataceae bacterium]